MEGAHSGSMGRSEAEMGAARGLDGARLRRDCELDAVRMRNGAVIGPPAFEVEQTHESQWTQRGIVEGAAAFQVGDTEGERVVGSMLSCISCRDSSDDRRLAGESKANGETSCAGSRLNASSRHVLVAAAGFCLVERNP